ncbi:hypothetical protein [Spirosoma lituiforme]
METIYNWLLQNMGNEGNAFTILNSRRTQRTEGGEYIQVMARLKDFSVVNLLVTNAQLTEDETARLTGGSDDIDQYTLASQQEVLDYLHTGERADVPSEVQEEALYLFVFRPAGETGELTFPPEPGN